MRMRCFAVEESDGGWLPGSMGLWGWKARERREAMGCVSFAQKVADDFRAVGAPVVDTEGGAHGAGAVPHDVQAHATPLARGTF